jgi:putative zinc finger/helix-turn-helix YgiT family protein
MAKITKCEVCGGQDFTIGTVDSKVRYKENISVVIGLKTQTCDGCGWQVFTTDSSKKLRIEYSSQRCKAEGLLTPHEIKDFRKDIGLSQEELSQLLDMSIKTIARYENGTAVPSKVASKFLKVLIKNRKVAIDEAVEMGFIDSSVFDFKNVTKLDVYKTNIQTAGGEKVTLSVKNKEVTSFEAIEDELVGMG